jgi:hypothetical protein
MKDKLKNVTFSLPEHTIGKVRELAGLYELSMNALVNDALEKWLQQLEKDALAKAMADASSDPLFMADMQNVSEDFQYADTEVASAIGSIEKQQKKSGGSR